MDTILDHLDIVSYFIVFAFWGYLLQIFIRAKAKAWRFFFGSTGLFLFSMIVLRPHLVKYLNFIITALVGIFGDITGIYETLFRESAVYITTAVGGVMLQIDVECSGIIEILAFLSILIFFDVYTVPEKFKFAIIGIFYIIFANVIRIVLISTLVYYFGFDIYDVAHGYIGRIVFYLLSIAMYFYIFTLPQIEKMRVGKFDYDKEEN